MEDSLTPMMRQYHAIRRDLPKGAILFFRLGDFYEMFFEDAVEAAPILDVALTKRHQTPMCGVPYHAADGYIAKLVKAGKRVAICDQVGEPQPGKIVERRLSQVISPGAVGDLQSLDAKKNNFLAAIRLKDGIYGFAFVDLSTGEFRLTELANEGELRDELSRVEPAEVLVSESQAEALSGVAAGAALCDSSAFSLEQAEFTLREHFAVQSLDGFGCRGMESAIGAAGAILHYLKRELRRQTAHIIRLACYKNTEYLILDAATQANLELVASRGQKDCSLLAALDRTATPMGARRLRDWILHPLRQLEPLKERQEIIADFLRDPFVLSQFRDGLKPVRDIERTMGRLGQGGGNARDLMALRQSLEQIPVLKALHPSASGMAEFPALIGLIQSAICDEPPVSTKDGGMFRPGYNAAPDELRAARGDGKDWIARLQQQEIETTGIKSLKVRYTSVFGYFIEVTKSNLASVPSRYVRKQTTVNGERFITPELKEMEGRILGADEQARHLEAELFARLRDEVLKELDALQRTASAIAILDAAASLAEVARLHGYCRPELTDGPRIHIRDGRHPVLDQNVAEEKFVPNDLELDARENRLLIITGPNMAGKSTYIRQAALLVLMAQIGSYIPAASAEIGLADRIFTRVGASDDLSRGQSTFMVEMNETVNIAKTATEKSLVILDEIGRGTSTFDGLSIAWSVAEYLHDAIKARTLFATHYHELTELEMTRSGVKNFNIAVREWNEQIIFLRKIVRGGADKSYGIQVARLAGLPPEVINRAKEILGNLEQAELNADGRPVLAEAPPPGKRPRRRKEWTGKPQLSLF